MLPARLPGSLGVLESLCLGVSEEEGWEETGLPSLAPALYTKRELLSYQLGGVESFLYFLTQEPAVLCSAFPCAWNSKCTEAGGQRPGLGLLDPLGGCPEFCSWGFPLGELLTTFPLFSPFSLVSSRLKTFLMLKIIILFWNCE